MSETIAQKTQRLIGGHYAADTQDEAWMHEVASQLNQALLAVRQGYVTSAEAGAICSLCERVAEFENIKFIGGAQ